MNRDQFFAALAPLDDERLRKALWTLYWRSSASMREHIEAAIDPGANARSSPRVKEPVDPQFVLDDVREFVALARSGAYMAGDRRVSRRERIRWRFTFQRLAADAQEALLAEDVTPGAAAIAELIDLVCEMRGYDYFHSEDPTEAARFVVSDVVGLLWSRLRDHYGFPEFAALAAPQLIRWESPYGWTRHGFGSVSDRERTLASVLAGMLSVPDMWVTLADRYLAALDRTTGAGAAGARGAGRSASGGRADRARRLAEWHVLLFERLVDSEGGDRLDRLVHHPALAGPDLALLAARLARHRGNVAGARHLASELLRTSPGHADALEFAVSIGAPLPPGAEQAWRERPR